MVKGCEPQSAPTSRPRSGRCSRKKGPRLLRNGTNMSVRRHVLNSIERDYVIIQAGWSPRQVQSGRDGTASADRWIVVMAPTGLRQQCAVFAYGSLIAEYGDAGLEYSTADNPASQPWTTLDPTKHEGNARATIATFKSLFPEAVLETDTLN